VARGERIGLVRFGSRVDLWLPGEAEIVVKVGENVKGGSTVVARMPEMANVRSGGNGDGARRASARLQGGQGS